MYCRSRGLAQETNTTKIYVTDFLYENLDTTTITNYDVIKNHFTNFVIDNEFNFFLIDQGNFSNSYLRFKLCKNEDEEDYVFLFAITINADLLTTPIYEYHFREDIGSFNDFLNNNPNLENFYINIEMETTFYLNLNIEENEEDETENEEDETEPIPVIENIFRTEECCVCLLNKSNILNYPCLHLSICKECEERGKFIKCVTCRKIIYRKIKI